MSYYTRKTFSAKTKKLLLSLMILIFVGLGTSVAIVANDTAVRAQSSTSSVSCTPTSTLYLGIVRLATLPSLNMLSPVNAYPIIAEMYLRFTYSNYPPSPLIEPQLGQSWSSNSNYTVWILTLKPNLKWDNGEPLNATDLWYSLYLYTQVDHGYIPFMYIKNVTILNSTSVKVILNQPDPNFILQLTASSANFVILPYQVYSKIPISQVAAYKNFENIVADGPFVIYNYTPGENPIIFTANPYFYRGKPHMKKLVLYLFSSQEAYMSALEAGKLDALWASGGYSVVAPLAKLPGYKIYRITPSGYEVAVLNVYAYPFNLTKFRQALAYATNRTLIAEKVFGPNYTLMPYDLLLPSINSEGYGPSAIPNYSYNLTEVKILMQSLGFKLVNGKWTYPNGTPVTINIIVPSDEPDSISVATLLESMWDEAGFTVTVTPMTEASVYSAIEHGDYQVAVYTDFGATGPVPWFDFYSQQPGNYYASPSLPPFNATYGKLLAKLESLPYNSPEAKNLSAEVAKIVAEQVPVIPLYVTYNWVVASTCFYWGNPANYTGIFSNELPVQMQLWPGALYVVHPIVTSTTPVHVTASTSLLMGIAAVVIIIVAVVAYLLLRRR